MKLGILAASTLAALCACGKVSGVNQKADAVVLDWRSSSDAVAGTVRTEKLLVGTQEKGVDHRVPVTVEWSVRKDDAGCLRVTAVKMMRTGGATSTEIYKARTKSLTKECTKRDPRAEESFDTVHVQYCWRWNGATNDDDCAYGGAFSISADLGLEGIFDRQP